MASAQTALHAFYKNLKADFTVIHGAEIPLRVAGVGEEYEATQSNLALFDGGDRGWVEITGEEATPYLQRILTSNVETLKVGESQWSALLDGKGHWLVELMIFHTVNHDGERVIALDMPLSSKSTLISLLEKFHFGEKVQWKEKERARLMLMGPNAKNYMPKKNINIRIERKDRGCPCWEFLGSAQEIQTEAEDLLRRGATPGGLVALDILRVEAGIPRFGTDFDNQSTLPETEEWRRASLNKGCYAGQEVIAKINTYGEAPRRLCQLSFEHGEESLAGTEIQSNDGKTMGSVSSWVWSPKANAPIGLGTVKRIGLKKENNPLFALADKEKIEIKATVPEKVFG